MIKQTIVGFIVVSDIRGKYWAERHVTSDIFEAKILKEKPNGVPPGRIKSVRVTIEELPYAMD